MKKFDKDKFSDYLIDGSVIVVCILFLFVVIFGNLIFEKYHENPYTKGCSCGGKYHVIALNDRSDYCLCECNNCGKVAKIREYDIINS